MSPIVVIDTNVWVSGLFWKGTVFKVLERFYNGEIVPCFSPETMEEWEEKVSFFAQVSHKSDLYFRTRKLLQEETMLVFPKEQVSACRDL